MICVNLRLKPLFERGSKAYRTSYSTMSKNIFLTLAALLLCLPFPTAAQDARVSLNDFKQDLMPQVGKTITVEGILQSGKLGWLVAFKDWGIYVYSAGAKDMSAMKALGRFSGKKVRATGKLQYFPAPPTAGDSIVAMSPEHFFFDASDAKIELAQQRSMIKETVRKPVVVTAAPAECLATFRQFFGYVQQDEPSIVTDERAQQRWLTKHLRDALKQKLATFKDQPDDPDFPGNGTFVGTWDKPSTFTILGSRRYHNRAVLEVWYEWGKGTNYPGDSRLSYFVFLLEEGNWKLDDVYTFRGEFVNAESLNGYLRSK
jgi:hypothetical protein